jgi:NADH:ubiquinone oxidoreductase subunit 5 (subunit L)/multisubunit Na+/H+ antiporter MnhA subunit
MEIFLLTAIFAPLCGAALTLAWGARLRDGIGYFAALFPLLSFGLLLYVGLELQSAQARSVFYIPWIPAFDVSLSLIFDGFALFFGLLVSGMGVLTYLYAAGYMTSKYPERPRFYAYLLIFTSAMLGATLAGNLLSLFVFWELTGVASFLLIGYQYETEKGRKGARMALIVTFVAGLFLLTGLILLGGIAGTYELAALFALDLRELAGERGVLLNAALVCILIGAAGKSAQFPLHFWLPNAMAAPAPVSAYLHSATMVKLGVFLVGRLFPIYEDERWFGDLLLALGFTTFVVGALAAFFAHEIKAILAYSTVAQLGVLIGVYGLAPAEGMRYDLMHILSHALYKGALFMIAGLVEKLGGRTDLRSAGSAGAKHPLLLALALPPLLSMASVPGLLGFLSKEYALKDALARFAEDPWLGGYAVGAILLGSVLTVAFTARFIYEFYFRAPDAPHADGDSSPGVKKLAPHARAAVFFAPGLLSLAVVVFGIWPAPVNLALQLMSVPGMTAPEFAALALWHGFKTELLLSLAALALGGTLAFAVHSVIGRFAAPAWFGLDRLFESVMNATPRIAAGVTRALAADRPTFFLPIILSFAAGLLAVILWPALPPHFETAARLAVSDAPLELALAWFTAALASVFVLAVALLRRWTSQIIALSVIGFLTTFYFVLYRAPDLALTQLLIETATLLLVLLLLARFPERIAAGEAAAKRSRGGGVFRATLALIVGAITFALFIAGVGERAADSAGDYYLENSLSLAAAGNAVNAILIDFRGFDTLFEVAVFLTAGLGSLGLLMRYRRPGERRPVDGALPVAPAERETHPADGNARIASPIYRAAAALLFFPILMFSLYLLMRGHNYPGGGFIAGLLSAVALMLLSFARGLEQFHRILPFDPMRLAAVGLLLTAAVSFAPVFLGAPFLKHWNGYVDLPGLGKTFVGTPLLFDIGVYLAVLGAVVKILFTLAKSVGGLTALVLEEERLYAAVHETHIEAPAFEAKIAGETPTAPAQKRADDPAPGGENA